MQIISHLNLITTITFTLLALMAAIIDYRTGKIPNVLTFSTMVIGLIFSFAITGTDGFISGLLGMLVGFLLFFPLFVTGVMGAGDGKLVMGLSTILGPWGASELTLWSLLVGGAASFVIVAARGRLRVFVQQVYKFMVSLFTPGLVVDWPKLDKTSKAPFGLAIFVGFIVVRLMP